MNTPGGTAPQLTNWAGNVRFAAERFHEPTTTAELQALVAGARRVRALGTGHSFNRIADTTGDLVSLRRLPTVLDIDSSARTARVSGATRYGDLGAALQRAGLALPNTGSLPHISIAGASATGTHGSGRSNPVLGRSVRSVTMVQGDGQVVTIARESTPDFEGYVLALGRLGLVTELVLDVVPTFDAAQTVVTDVPDDSLTGHLVEIMSAAYSVSVFTALVPDQNRIWLKERVGAAATVSSEGSLWGGRLATVPQHPIDGIDPASATEQLGVPGPWIERLPHFRLEFQPSAGDELQSEYLLPLDRAQEAWSALTQIRDVLRGPLLTCEIRCVAGDSMWLSPTVGRESIAFHFTWQPDLTRASVAVGEIERQLAPYDARPHWGKVFTTRAEELPALYPRLADFRRLVDRHDPAGTFGNDLVDGWLQLG
jgi:xylitol oxidase